MNLEILETIKKHISNVLGVELVKANTERDAEAFNIKFSGATTCIYISRPFIHLLKESADINSDLKDLDILSIVKANPLCNISLNFGGIKIEPINQ